MLLKRLFKKNNDNNTTRFKFQVNQTVKLYFELNGIVYNLSTRIQDVFSDSIKIYSPTSEGRPVPLENGFNIDVKVIDSSGVYSFDSVIMGRSGGQIPALLLSKPVKVNRQQRRKNIRVRASLSVGCELLENHDLDIDDQPLWTRDLSEGGLCLAAPFKLPLNGLVKMRVTLLNPDRVIEAKARILRVIDDSIYKQYLNCVEFVEMSEEHSSYIAEFVKANQRSDVN